MLQVAGLEARYGRAQVLFDVSFSVGAGETVVVLGRNGAGKSTTLKTVMGLVQRSGGSVQFGGREIGGWEPYRVARGGIGYVPEERRIFAELTVMENLEVGRRGTGGWTPERLFQLFPNLADMRGRRGDAMSGGEQQMLAIARTLMGNPRLLLLDEPSAGLAPVIVQAVGRAVLALKAEGVSVLLAEQNLRFATGIADRAVVLERGRTVWSGAMAGLAADEGVRRAYLAL